MKKDIPNNYLEKAIVDIEIRVAILETLLKKEFESRDIAMDLKSKEVERRLIILNGEAERLRQMQATYITREIWNTKHEELCRQVDELKEFKNKSIGQQAVITAIISILVSFILLYLKI